MLEACDRFNDGKIDTEDLRHEVDSLGEALEDSHRRKLQPLIYKFWIDIYSHAADVDLGDSEGGWARIDATILLFKQQLTSYLSGMPAELYDDA